MRDIEDDAVRAKMIAAGLWPPTKQDAGVEPIAGKAVGNDAPKGDVFRPASGVPKYNRKHRRNHKRRRKTPSTFAAEIEARRAKANAGSVRRTWRPS